MWNITVAKVRYSKKDTKNDKIFQLIAMGAEYSSYVKSIATRAPTFYGYIISVLASVSEEDHSTYT